MRAPHRFEIAVAVCIGCSAAPPPGPGPRDMAGAEMSASLAPPELGEAPARTRLSTVALRGTTDGKRIVVQGSAVAETPVFPGGSFCVDLPLAAGQTASFRLYALSGDGRVSPPALAEVIQDPNGPEPTSATCSGQVACAETESCDNGVDDDCNGWVDRCDPFCNSCLDDALEPNDAPIQVPTVSAGAYSLKLCPCREDWFSFTAAAGASIWVEARYTPGPSFNPVIKLLRAADAEQQVDTPVASALGYSGVQTIRWQATQAGTYYLRIYSSAAPGVGSYTLTIH